MAVPFCCHLDLHRVCIGPAELLFCRGIRKRRVVHAGKQHSCLTASRLLRIFQENRFLCVADLEADARFVILQDLDPLFSAGSVRESPSGKGKRVPLEFLQVRKDIAFYPLFFQQDPLHQGFLPLRDRQAVIGLPGKIFRTGKAQRQRVLIFIYGKSEHRKRIVLFFLKELPVVVVEPFHFLISKRQERAVAADLISDTCDLVCHRPVVEVVVQVDHAVALSCLCKKLLDRSVRQAPVILGVGHIMEQGKIVGQIPSGVPVKPVISNQSLHSRRVGGLHSFNILPGMIFLKTAVHPARNEVHIGVQGCSPDDCCQKDSAQRRRHRGHPVGGPVRIPVRVC